MISFCVNIKKRIPITIDYIIVITFSADHTHIYGYNQKFRIDRHKQVPHESWLCIIIKNTLAPHHPLSLYPIKFIQFKSDCRLTQSFLHRQIYMNNELWVRCHCCNEIMFLKGKFVFSYTLTTLLLVCEYWILLLAYHHNDDWG